MGLNFLADLWQTASWGKNFDLLFNLWSIVRTLRALRVTTTYSKKVNLTCSLSLEWFLQNSILGVRFCNLQIIVANKSWAVMLFRFSYPIEISMTDTITELTVKRVVNENLILHRGAIYTEEMWFSMHLSYW